MQQKVKITVSDLDDVDINNDIDENIIIKNDKPPSALKKAILLPLVLIFPLLCFVAVIIRLAQSKNMPKKAIGWLKYCNSLLIISGLISISGAVICYNYRYDVFINSIRNTVAKPQFILNTNKDFVNTFSHEELKTKELAKKVEENIFITSKARKLARPSIKQIIESGFGTSFLIYANKNECLLVTFRHVIDGEEWESDKPFKGDIALWDRKEGFAVGKVVGRHKKLDLMLIQLKRDQNLKDSSFVQTVLDSNKTDLGERVMVYGHPEGLFFSIADGLISRKDDSGIIQITAPVSPGDSGGPVYNMHGQLVGVVSSMLDKTVNKNSENLNFAIPADALLKINDWNLDDKEKPLLQEYIQKELSEQKQNN